MDRDAAGYVIEPVESAPFGQVSYVAWRSGAKEALVVDPGFDPGAIAEVLDRFGLSLVAILNTHGHADHIAGNAAMKQIAPNAPLLIGKNEAHLLTDGEANLSTPFGLTLTSPSADRLLEDGERFEAAGLSFEAREIPGHSPGSMVYVSLDADPPFVFGGDVLFAGSVGRADFPGGSATTLLDGIRRRLFDLPEATIVLPGHGATTTIGREKRTNPYVGENPGTYRLD
jgi:glyoxylase-like metal-dependent hydrolase (beta-lactamase superfamily II)